MGLAAQREFLAESGVLLGTANGIDKSGQKHAGARVFSVLHDLVPRALMIALRALVAVPGEVGPALVSGAPLNARNEVAALRLLCDKCLAQLSGSCSNGEGVDEAAMTQGSPMNARARWAAILRVGQRDILRATLRRAEKLAGAALDYDGTVSSAVLRPAMDPSALVPGVLARFQQAVKAAMVNSTPSEATAIVQSLRVR